MGPMSQTPTTMIEMFPQFSSRDSIFQKMQEAPWPSVISASMDLAYFTMYSMNKRPSMFVRYNYNDGIVDSSTIAQTLIDLHREKWTKLWTALTSEYNPIQNVDIKETITRTRTDDRDISKDGTLSSTVDGTVEQTSEDNSTETLTHGHNITTTDDITSTVNSDGSSTTTYGKTITVEAETDDFTYAFNSSDEVPTSVEKTNSTETQGGTDKTDTTNDSTTDTDETITEKHTGDDKTVTVGTGKLDIATKDVRADNTAETTKDNLATNEDITRIKQGNSGQYPYQDLLLKEFELWKWDFYKVVFEDCDKFLCLAIFDMCS